MVFTHKVHVNISSTWTFETVTTNIDNKSTNDSSIETKTTIIRITLMKELPTQGPGTRSLGTLLKVIP